MAISFFLQKKNKNKRLDQWSEIEVIWTYNQSKRKRKIEVLTNLCTNSWTIFIISFDVEIKFIRYKNEKK
jgi:hypothetical protein